MGRGYARTEGVWQAETCADGPQHVAHFWTVPGLERDGRGRGRNPIAKAGAAVHLQRAAQQRHVPVPCFKTKRRFEDRISANTRMASKCELPPSSASNAETDSASCRSMNCDGRLLCRH